MIMKNKYLFTVIFFTLLSCKKQLSTTTIQRELSEFDTVTFNSVYDVEITQDTANFMEIIGATQIVEKIDVNVSNGNLILTTDYHGNWMHPSNNKISIRLHTNGLHFIKANETCNIRSTNALSGDEIGLVMTSKLNGAELKLNCNSFYYWNNFPCGGKITLSGQVNNLKLWNVALMAVDAQALTCQNALVENGSKGDCKLTCLQQLTCALRGEGNIYLWGNPPNVTISEQSNTGKLIKQ
jgi:hypothetical protein